MLHGLRPRVRKTGRRGARAAAGARDARAVRTLRPAVRTARTVERIRWRWHEGGLRCFLVTSWSRQRRFRCPASLAYGCTAARPACHQLYS